MPILGSTIMLIAGAFVLGALAAWWGSRRWRSAARASADRVIVQTIAERVRSVGRLVGLEVCAKEIATATSGWAWMPPALLSQARMAMIFHFEKRYWADLARVRASDVTALPDGSYRVNLPPIEGALRLIDVVPYDIQNARVLGLLDVIPMTAERQRALMSRAQRQAAEFIAASDARYEAEARASVERQIAALLALFRVRVEVVWAEAPAPRSRPSAAPVVRPALQSAAA